MEKLISDLERCITTTQPKAAQDEVKQDYDSRLQEYKTMDESIADLIDKFVKQFVKDMVEVFKVHVEKAGLGTIGEGDLKQLVHQKENLKQNIHEITRVVLLIMGFNVSREDNKDIEKGKTWLWNQREAGLSDLDKVNGACFDYLLKKLREGYTQFLEKYDNECDKLEARMLQLEELIGKKEDFEQVDRLYSDADNLWMRFKEDSYHVRRFISNPLYVRDKSNLGVLLDQNSVGVLVSEYGKELRLKFRDHLNKYKKSKNGLSLKKPEKLEKRICTMIANVQKYPLYKAVAERNDLVLCQIVNLGLYGS